jgi:hypothetical protein
LGQGLHAPRIGLHAGRNGADRCVIGRECPTDGG